MDLEKKVSKDGFKAETEQGWIQRRNWARMDLEEKLSKDGFKEETEQQWIQRRN